MFRKKNINSSTILNWSAVFCLLMVFMSSSGINAAAQGEQRAVKKINLLKYIEAHTHQEFTSFLKHFQKSKKENQLQDKLIRIYNRLKDSNSKQDHLTLHKIVYAMQCCANKKTLEFFGQIISSGDDWFVIEEALHGLHIFPSKLYAAFLLDKLIKNPGKVENQIIKILGDIEYTEATDILCSLLNDHNRFALESLVNLNSNKALQCLLRYPLLPDFVSVEKANVNSLITLSILFKHLSNLKVPASVNTVYFSVLFKFLNSHNELLRENVLKLLAVWMDVFPQKFIKSFKRVSPRVQLSLIPIMNKSKTMPVIEHLLQISCCSTNMVLRHEATSVIHSSSLSQTQKSNQPEQSVQQLEQSVQQLEQSVQQSVQPQYLATIDMYQPSQRLISINTLKKFWQLDASLMIQQLSRDKTGEKASKPQSSLTLRGGESVQSDDQTPNN